MPRISLVFCLFLTTPLLCTASAEEQVCPNLARANQVGNCPSEAELRHTFHGFCNDERHLYIGDAEVCTDYQAYRRLKNIAPWESADGNFMAYLSCELPAAHIQALRAQRMAVSRVAKITLLTCDYGNGIQFTHRTRLTCTVTGQGSCASEAESCSAQCE